MTYDPSVRATHFAFARTRRGWRERETERVRKQERQSERVYQERYCISRSLLLLSRSLLSGAVLHNPVALIPLRGIRAFRGGLGRRGGAHPILGRKPPTCLSFFFIVST